MRTGRQWFFERVNAYAAERRISARQLAAYIGASHDTVSNWMEGKSAPNATHLKRLADFTGLSADWWIGVGL